MKRTTTSTISILFSFLFIFFASNSLYSQSIQEPECGTEYPSDYVPERLKNTKDYQLFLREFQAKQSNRTLAGTCINSAPIKAHIIRQSDGSGGLTVQQLNDAIDTMNTFYANSCIEFYLCGGINYIDNDTYYNFHKDDEVALRDAHNETDLINIYFANSVTREGTDGPVSLCGYAYYPGGPDLIMMRNSCTINGSTLSHEVGHFFSLPHTHNGGNELVDGSNCATEGDRFCDTPADPTIGSSTVNSSCVYTGTSTDANGDTYAPNPRAIMSYSRKSCRDEFSPEQYAAMAYTFLNVRNYWACPDFDVDFEVDVATSCSSPLLSTFTEMAVGESTYEWDFDNDGVVDDTNANPTYSFPADGVYDVALTVSDGTTNIRKIKTALINIGATSYPYVEAMETWVPSTGASGFDNGWSTFPENTTSGYRWNVNNGGTPSSTTGPDGDHTTTDGSGIYVFTEATGSDAGDVAELISPCIEVPTNFAASDYSIRFWYHMYGSGMGTLHIDLYDGNNWINDFTPAISGQQQSGHADAYLEKVFSVNTYQGQSIKIRFRGIRGNGFTSDIAIDDFEIFDVSPLPVQLMDFSGRNLENGQHLLNWSTATEQNSDYFLVEHSIDGERFEALNQVPAKGESYEQQDYFFTNSTPQSGINYYRLKMVDWDGSFSYSNIVQLEMKREGDGLSIFPNPGKGLYQLELATDVKQVTFQVYNAVGQVVKQGQWNPRESFLSLDLSNFANGIYLIQIRDGNIMFDTQRIIKQ